MIFKMIFKLILMLALLAGFAYVKETATLTIVKLYFVALLPLETIILFWEEL